MRVRSSSTPRLHSHCVVCGLRVGAGSERKSMSTPPFSVASPVGASSSNRLLSVGGGHTPPSSSPLAPAPAGGLSGLGAAGIATTTAVNVATEDVDSEAMFRKTKASSVATRAVCLPLLLISTAILLGVGGYTAQRTQGRKARAGVAAAMFMNMVTLLACVAEVVVAWLLLAWSARLALAATRARSTAQDQQRQRARAAVEQGTTQWAGLA